MEQVIFLIYKAVSPLVIRARQKVSTNWPSFVSNPPWEPFLEQIQPPQAPETSACVVGLSWSLTRGTPLQQTERYSVAFTKGEMTFGCTKTHLHNDGPLLQYPGGKSCISSTAAILSAIWHLRRKERPAHLPLPPLPGWFQSCSFWASGGWGTPWAPDERLWGPPSPPQRSGRTLVSCCCRTKPSSVRDSGLCQMITCWIY